MFPRFPNSPPPSSAPVYTPNPTGPKQRTGTKLSTNTSSTIKPGKPTLTPSSSSSVNNLDEPPLLEELGIDLKDIWTKTKLIILPTKRLTPETFAESDLAGPLFFCLLLGLCLLLRAKVHFGYIYGFGMSGCLAMYMILNLMSEGVSIERVTSALGYSLLPIILLAAASIFLSLRDTFGTFLVWGAIGWSTYSATRYFETVLSMKEQRFLVGYPVMLLYACFALLTVF